MGTKHLYVLGAIVVLVIVLIVAYEKKKLNKVLPTKWQKQSFVGSMARTPGMQNCLAFSDDGDRSTYFNRCTWV